jgi:hypothetical protein
MRAEFKKVLAQGEGVLHLSVTHVLALLTKQAVSRCFDGVMAGGLGAVLVNG